MQELTKNEYFESAPEPEKKKRMRALFESEIDYSYFAVKFGWTRDQYESITPVERLFIRKEIELSTVRDQELLQQTFELAIGNVLRKKGKKYKKLLKKIREELEEPIPKSEYEQLKKAIKAQFKSPIKK